jgi:hypothetical protein
MQGTRDPGDYSKRRFADFVAARLSVRRTGQETRQAAEMNLGRATIPRLQSDPSHARNEADLALKDTSFK